MSENSEAPKVKPLEYNTLRTATIVFNTDDRVDNKISIATDIIEELIAEEEVSPTSVYIELREDLLDDDEEDQLQGNPEGTSEG